MHKKYDFSYAVIIRPQSGTAYDLSLSKEEVMPILTGSQTEQNLLFTHAAESMARIRYEIFAAMAKKEGHLHATATFEEAALQEREHAKRMFLCLKGNDVEISRSISIPALRHTPENLEAAINGENVEWREIYPGFADTAEKEGFPQMAKVWRSIAIAEKYHEKRFQALLQNMQTGKELEDFYRSLITGGKSSGSPAVRCVTCGYVAEDGIIPQYCPVCGSPPEKFKKLLG